MMRIFLTALRAYEATARPAGDAAVAGRFIDWVGAQFCQPV